LVTENDRNQFLNRYCGKNIITGHDYEENKEDKVSIIHEKSKEERKELTIKEIIRISELLHKCPTAKEYNYYNKEGYSSSTIGKVFGISYRRLCEQYIGKDMMDIRKLPTNLSKEEQKELLGNELISAYNKLGFVPIQNDMKKYGLYSLTSYMNVFNKSYNEILNELGLPVNARYEIDKSNEILLNEFYKVFKSINRIPLGREFIKYGLEGVWNYRNKFGSIRKVCELLDIDYTKYYKVKNKAGIICFDDNGDTCRSVIEKDISNFFIMNKLNYEKEYKYSNLIKGDKRRFDWKVVINDKNFYIEYAGLYRENATHGIQIRYNNKIKNKLKSLGKCGFINQCIFIYPNDVYSKSLKEIFEPIFNINLKNLEYSRCNSAIKYNELSEEELFEMYKSIQVKTNDITVYNIIKENYSLYAEIINRYQNFYSFLSKHNIFCNKPKGYWNKETLNENFLYCFRKHNKILSFQEIRNECKIDLKLKGFYSAIQTYGGYEKILTNFKEYCINNNIII
jgi:hypothetical protein